MITTQLVALRIIDGAGGSPIPPTPVQPPFSGAGQGLGGDYYQKVANYWAEIEAKQSQQRHAAEARDKLEAESDAERQRIHARMAELRDIKAGKRVKCLQVAAELDRLTAEQSALEMALQAAADAQDAFALMVEQLIVEMEDYQRRYRAALTVLLLTVN